MKKWEIVGKIKTQNSKFTIDSLIDLLLQNRGINSRKEQEEFLNPKLEEVTTSSTKIDKKQLKKALTRIQKAIEKKQQVVIYGDYDVDGICGTAILWETLHSLGAYVIPYIPHRVDEGYGLSIKGIDSLKEQLENIHLIITVDNGIVAKEAVTYANKQGIDVIISDHHVPEKKHPDALAIVHTVKLCGTGVAYLFSEEIRKLFEKKEDESHLELVALATIADLVPLTGENRTLTKFGLEKLRKTKRPGLLALFEEAALDPSEIDVYEVGHIICPRLNAMGRLEYAMDSLRLVCTKNSNRALELARKLGETNRQRQGLTQQTVTHARQQVSLGTLPNGAPYKKLLFIAHETYQQGVIGLVAGKLVEEFYRPAIVLSKGAEYTKASARSVSGFNIIEFIRNASEFLVDAGGHPMAAGFTVETSKLEILQKRLEDMAETLLDEEVLTRKLRVDSELPLSFVSQKLFDSIQKLSPFGMGNPEPTFVSRDVTIEEMRLVGRDRNHLKICLSDPNTSKIDCIAFGFGSLSQSLAIGDRVDVVYTIAEDRWNGNRKMQLKIKDIRKN